MAIAAQSHVLDRQMSGTEGKEKNWRRGELNPLAATQTLLFDAAHEGKLFFVIDEVGLIGRGLSQIVTRFRSPATQWKRVILRSARERNCAHRCEWSELKSRRLELLHQVADAISWSPRRESSCTGTGIARPGGRCCFLWRIWRLTLPPFLAAARLLSRESIATRLRRASTVTGGAQGRAIP